jgi:hypothetical protein
VGFSASGPITSVLLETTAGRGFPQGAVIDLIDVYQVAAPPVPEPAQWILLLIGTSLTGAALRSRRGRAQRRRPAA